MSAPARHVVMIPGKNPKPPASIHREILWRCIAAGASGADGEAISGLAALERNFHIAGWNHLYYGRDADINTDLPWVAGMLIGKAPPPAPPGAAWRMFLRRVMYTLGDLMPLLTKLAADAEAQQLMEETRRYFEDEDGVATAIRRFIKAELQPLFASGAEVMVIGHSLGSVIAYDVLWEMTWQDGQPWHVDHLLTLGSPLGMFYVQRRLRGRRERGIRRYPGNVLHWSNVTAEGDLTALDRGLRNDFHEMLALGLVRDLTDYKHGIHTSFRTADGPNPHRCYGYFFNPVVARMITGWMRGEPYPPSAHSHF
ncbi:MAG TPA: hypothetical protein VLV87_12320 [Gammaproteobacteria bacterium]|nr:hypothetical protein [Gammaproteobacteria bacterium]